MCLDRTFAPSNTYQAPVRQWLHVSRAPGLVGSRGHRSESSWVSPSSDFVSALWRRERTLHPTLIEAQPPGPAGAVKPWPAVGASGKRSCLRPRNTFVPSCRPTQQRGAGGRATGARRPFVSGSGEGQRSGRADAGLSQMNRSERGRPIKGGSLPGVRTHDATASSEGPILRSATGISFGLHLVWLALDDGLTLSPPSTPSGSGRDRRLACASA